MSLKLEYLQKKPNESLSAFSDRIDSLPVVHAGYAYFSTDGYDESRHIYGSYIVWNGELNKLLFEALLEYGYVIKCSRDEAYKMLISGEGIPVYAKLIVEEGKLSVRDLYLTFNDKKYVVSYMGLCVHKPDFICFKNINEPTDDVDLGTFGEGSFVRYSVSGSYNTGSFNLGSFNLGSFNLGSFSLGSFNINSFNARSFSTSSFNIGSFNIGSFTASNFAQGSFNVGSYNLGSFSLGGFNLGSFNIGSFNIGSFNAGSYNIGSFALYFSNLGSFNLGSYNLGSFNIGSFSNTLFSHYLLTGSFNISSFSIGSFVNFFNTFTSGSFILNSFNLNSFNVGSFNVGSFDLTSFNLSSFNIGSFNLGSYNPINIEDNSNSNNDKLPFITSLKPEEFTLDKFYQDIYGIGSLGYGLNLI